MTRKIVPIPFPQLHPEVEKVAKSLYESGHFTDALRKASIRLEEVCKSILKEKTGDEETGTTLMARLFAEKDGKVIYPMVHLGLKDSSDKQKSHYFLFSGFAGVIRNNLAHSTNDLDDIEALYGLNVTSYLFYKLDRARELNRVDEPTKKQEAGINRFEEKLTDELEQYLFESLASKLLADTRIKNIPSQTQDKINARLEVTKLTEDILISSIDEIGEPAYNTYSTNPGNKILIDYLISQLYDSKY